MNSSHHRIFKCIAFISSHYFSVINLDVALLLNDFSEFDFVSQ